MTVPGGGESPWQQPQYGATPPAPGGYGPPPAGAPAGWGPPPHHPSAYAPAGRTNGMAIASLVLGIVWLYWVGSVLALVFGYVARRQIRERGESGDGLAVAGIVLGWVGVGILATFLVVMLGAVASGA